VLEGEACLETGDTIKPVISCKLKPKVAPTGPGLIPLMARCRYAAAPGRRDANEKALTDTPGSARAINRPG